jgi:hypothetical protein
MRYRGKLGTRRIDRYLGDSDVNVAAIPWLTEPHEVWGPDKRPIGGDAPKDFVIIESGDPYSNAYIAKCPRKQGPKECVTEYVIACIGKMLPLKVAGARLVRMPPPPGVECDVRFMSRYFLPRRNESLMHGIEAVAKCFEMEESEIKREIPRGKPAEWKFYTVELIADVLDEMATTEQERVKLINSFARMMAFDALVGANDRHPRNWGLVYDAARPIEFRFSPVFDTSRGLFWNYSDRQLEQQEKGGFRDESIRSYSEGSRPLVSMERAKDSGHPNHFDVIEYMINSAKFREPVRQVIQAFSPQECAKMLHRKIGRIFSRRRLEHIDALLRYRHKRLKVICKL